MNQIHVEIIELELVKSLLQFIPNVVEMVGIIPQFGCNE